MVTAAMCAGRLWLMECCPSSSTGRPRGKQRHQHATLHDAIQRCAGSRLPSVWSVRVGEARHSPANTRWHRAGEKRQHLAGVVHPDDGDSTALVVCASCQDANYNRHGDDAAGVVSGGFGQRIARLSAG